MRSFVSLCGIILIVLGIISLSYNGISYTQREKVLEVGDVQVTADQQKTIYFPPAVGGAAIVAGIALVFISRRSK